MQSLDHCQTMCKPNDRNIIEISIIKIIELGTYFCAVVLNNLEV